MPELVWTDEIRCIGVFIMRDTQLKCSVDQAKRSFYRAANSIFAKVDSLLRKSCATSEI